MDAPGTSDDASQTQVPPSDSVTQDSEVESRVRRDAKADTPYVWPIWKLVLLALPQLGVQVMWAFVGPNAAPFMRHLGVSASLATLNNLAGPLTGFFTGPIVGAWSDRCTSRFGRRRPFILGGLLSTLVAGPLYAASEHIFSGSSKIIFAVVMFWVMDVTINMLQTPHRALVADLASEEQQLPMQVTFVFMMAIGNFIGYSIMQIWAVPAHHMLELMLIICAINVICVAVQFLIAREEPWVRPLDAPGETVCAPIVGVVRAVVGQPCLLYHLIIVQCLVWIGNTAWTYYASQWFANVVYQGDQMAPEGSAEKMAYAQGYAAFSLGGQLRSVLQLVSALCIIALLLKTAIRPRLVYAPCIFIGALVSWLAFAVGSSGAFAVILFTFSMMPETGSFAIPFGLVAVLNQQAEKEGRQVSTALQMALLNCCITVGQQICHVTLAAIEHDMSLVEALPYAFVMAGVTHTLGGFGALFLNDRPAGPSRSPASLGESADDDVE